jgi:rhodanese-related sulfurtransferase
MKLRNVFTWVIISIASINILYAGQVSSISPETAKKLMDSNQAVFVDVREIDELLAGTIHNSINIPMSLMSNNENLFNKKINQLPKNKTVVVFCRSGRRSGIVGDILNKKGFKVVNLGGYADWKNKIQN